MRPTYLVTLTLVSLLNLCACGDDSDSDAGGADAGTDAAADDGAGALRVASFNAGLLDSVGYVPERAPLVIESVAELDVDVLCVQEFWQQAHWDELVEQKSETHPHVLDLPPRPGVEGECNTDEFAPLRTCAEASCSDVGASELVTCTTSECPMEVAELSTSCISCLLDNTESGDFDVIETACVGSGAAGGDGGTVPPDERSYLIGGSFGIGLLSSVAYEEMDSRELDASTNRRAILYALLDTPELGELHLFCTHLAPIELGVSYEGSYGSWEEENAAHVETLIEWVDDKAGEQGQVVIMGDLNTGPQGDDIDEAVPDHYARLPAAGFENAFLDSDGAACTFCNENPLVNDDGDSGDGDASGAAIDHILTRGIAATDAVRIFDEPVEVELDAEERELRLSDHYGVEATITRE